MGGQDKAGCREEPGGSTEERALEIGLKPTLALGGGRRAQGCPEEKEQRHKSPRQNNLSAGGVGQLC